ncbi:hypothetical protein [Enterococcus faecalis]|uniref:hypothetical protein n=1 Tax=Enterococcus faecalis TaxID=1351 RepID=UPI0012B4760C|nr:hypothetical protein GIR35_12065 [Enterococcus faecalis]
MTQKNEFLEESYSITNNSDNDSADLDLVFTFIAINTVKDNVLQLQRNERRKVEQLIKQ